MGVDWFFQSRNIAIKPFTQLTLKHVTSVAAVRARGAHRSEQHSAELENFRLGR